MSEPSEVTKLETQLATFAKDAGAELARALPRPEPRSRAQNVALALVAVIKWPLAGALFAAGALAVAAKYGKEPVRALGKSAGEGAAEAIKEGIPFGGLMNVFSSGERYGRWRHVR